MIHHRRRLSFPQIIKIVNLTSIDTVYAGDIAAAVGLKNTTTGDTLCDEKHPIILESMEFPEPVIRVAIEPKTCLLYTSLGRSWGPRRGSGR